MIQSFSTILRGMISAALCSLVIAPTAVGQSAQDIPIGGFTPWAIFGLTDEFKTDDAPSTWFIADAQNQPQPGASWFEFDDGVNSDIAFGVGLVDSGAQASVLRYDAWQRAGLVGSGFDGANTAEIGGVSGIELGQVQNPLGIYFQGFGAATGASPYLQADTSQMVGQTSVSVIRGGPNSGLPNVLGLPMFEPYTIAIRNSQPVIQAVGGTTYRTPTVQFLGANQGAAQGISRSLTVSFEVNSTVGTPEPFYIYDLFGALEGNPLHENPLSPTAIAGAIFNNAVDVSDNGLTRTDRRFFVDTGAQVTVIDQTLLSQTGNNINNPDFTVPIIGGGGTLTQVPGFILDSLTIYPNDGPMVLTNIPVVVLDQIPNPTQEGTAPSGILGMNVFWDRDIVIDMTQINTFTRVNKIFISDPVTDAREWGTAAASASWHASTSWDADGTPGIMWLATVKPTGAADQQAIVNADSQVFKAYIGGHGGATMTVAVQGGATLTTFNDLDVGSGGVLRLEGGTASAANLNLYGGTLAGDGTVAASLENYGIVTPGASAGILQIAGTYGQRGSGSLVIELGGTDNSTTPQFDQVLVDDFAVLGGGLSLSLINGYSATLGDQFDILIADGGVSGTFDTLVGITIDPDTALAVTYQPDRIRVTVATVGDLTLDGVVNEFDLARMAANWLSDDATWADGDVNGDGVVDMADLYGLAGQWHSGPLSTEAVAALADAFIPEPGTLAVLAGLGGLMAAYRPRRRAAQAA